MEILKVRLDMNLKLKEKVNVRDMDFGICYIEGDHLRS